LGFALVSVKPNLLFQYPFMIIAIDGFSSCGKSTLAKDLAAILELPYVDTGAMYRAVTLGVLRAGIDPQDENAVNTLLPSLLITFDRVDGVNSCFLNGVNVEEDIRSLQVSNSVSEVSTLGAVRTKLVELQRAMGAARGLVMDGRDIGTVVFPKANFKFFITADPLIRAQRRRLELEQKGQIYSLEEVLQNLQHRDKIDSTRAIAPLRKADDAIEIDNSNMTKSEQLALVLSYIQTDQSED